MRVSIARLGMSSGASLLLAVACSVGVAAGSQSKTYYVPVGDGPVQADTGPALCEPTVGSACFDVSGSDIDVSITDATGQPTPARVFMAPATGDPVLLCGKGHVKLPDDTTQIEIRVGFVGRGTIPINPPPTPDWRPTLACPQPEPASTGTITVSGPGVKDATAEATPSKHRASVGWSVPKTIASSTVVRSRRAPLEL
jgi:hypothetical protein